MKSDLKKLIILGLASITLMGLAGCELQGLYDYWKTLFKNSFGEEWKLWQFFYKNMLYFEVFKYLFKYFLKKWLTLLVSFDIIIFAAREKAAIYYDIK